MTEPSEPTATVVSASEHLDQTNDAVGGAPASSDEAAEPAEIPTTVDANSGSVEVDGDAKRGETVNLVVSHPFFEGLKTVVVTVVRDAEHIVLGRWHFSGKHSPQTIPVALDHPDWQGGGTVQVDVSAGQTKVAGHSFDVSD